MHGVQPMAKIAPSPNDASQPPRELTSRPPSRSPMLGCRRRRLRRSESSRSPSRASRAAPASSGRQRPLEGRDAEDPGQVEAHAR